MFKDAEAYPKYEAMLESLAEFLEPIMTMTPLSPNKSSIGDYMGYFQFALQKRAKLKKEWQDLLRFLTGPAMDMLNHWFESEELKVTVATDAVSGSHPGGGVMGTPGWNAARAILKA